MAATDKRRPKSTVDDNNTSVLFMGCFNGDVMLFKFLQSNTGLLRRKHVDKVTVFYWNVSYIFQ